MGALSKSKIHPTSLHFQVDDNYHQNHHANPSTPTINHPITKSKVFFKTNGWTQPFHPLQLLAFFFFFYFTGICFFIMFPMLPTSHLRNTIYSITGLLFASHLIFHLINITINPADPAVIDKYKADDKLGIDQTSSRKGPATFDRTKHNHVIENQFCYICEVTVGPRSKHCSVCNKCVSDFDHHCKWLNNCVGGANYRLFLVCVTIAMLGAVSIFGLTIVFTIAYFNQSSWFYDESIWENDFITNGLLRAYIINPSSCYPSIWISIIILTSILSLITAILLLHLLCFHIFLNCIGLSTYEFIVSRRQTKDLESENKAALISSSLSSTKLNLPSKSNESPIRWFRWCCHGQNNEKQNEKVKVNGSTTDLDSNETSQVESTIIPTKGQVSQNPLIGIHQVNVSSLFGRLTSASSTRNQQQQLTKQNVNLLKEEKTDSMEENYNHSNTDLYIKSMHSYTRTMLRNSWLNNHKSFEESHGEVYLGSPERRFWESLRTNILPVNHHGYNQLTLNNAKNTNLIEPNISEQSNTHNSMTTTTPVNIIQNIPQYQIPSKGITENFENDKFSPTDCNNYKLSNSLQSSEPIFTPIHFRGNLINGRTSRLSFASKLIDSTPIVTSGILSNTSDIVNDNSGVNLISSPSSGKDVDKVNPVRSSKLLIKSKSTDQRTDFLLLSRQSTQPDLLTGMGRPFIATSIDNLRENNLRNQLFNQSSIKNTNNGHFIPRRSTIEEIQSTKLNTQNDESQSDRNDDDYDENEDQNDTEELNSQIESNEPNSCLNKQNSKLK